MTICYVWWTLYDFLLRFSFGTFCYSIVFGCIIFIFDQINTKRGVHFH